MCLFPIPGLLIASIIIRVVTRSWFIVSIMLAGFLVMGVLVFFLLKTFAKKSYVFNIEDDFLQCPNGTNTDKVYFSQMQSFYVSKQMMGFQTLHFIPKDSSAKPICLDLFSSLSEKDQAFLIELLQQKNLSYLPSAPQK